MAETDTHRDLMIDNISRLKRRYAPDSNVYVSGNNFIYYLEGDSKKRISPDTYVVFGVNAKTRDSYKTWEEGGRLPDVVFEFTSRKTQREDKNVKYPLYEKVLRVSEYFRFDPTGDYLNPRLQGFRLVGGIYQPIEMVENRLYSEKLELELVMEGENLRLYDPAKKEWLLTPAELAVKVEQEARRAEQEAQHAEQEARRAEQEARRAEQAVGALRNAKDEIEKLQARLAQLESRNK